MYHRAASMVPSAHVVAQMLHAALAGGLHLGALQPACSLDLWCGAVDCWKGL